LCWKLLEVAIERLAISSQQTSLLAELLQHGLVKSSFVPPAAIRELRDLTRYRVNLVQECNRIANRIQKVLEDANLKLGSVVTDPLGASGRAMLEAIIVGENDARKLAEMSRGILRRKIAELETSKRKLLKRLEALGFRVTLETARQPA
jgi:hypothetical protein